VPPFDELSPPAENVAGHFYTAMSRGLGNTPVSVRVREVKVWETDIQSASYRPK